MALFRSIFLCTICCFLHIAVTTTTTTVGDFYLPLLQRQELTCSETPVKTMLVDSLQTCQRHCLAAFNSDDDSCTVVSFQRRSINNVTDVVGTPPLHQPYQCHLFATCGLVDYVDSSTSVVSVDLYQLNYFQIAANVFDTSATALSVDSVSMHAMYSAQQGQSTRALMLFLSVIRMLRQYEIDELEGEPILPTDERYVTKYRAFTNVGVLLLGSDFDAAVDAKMGMRFYE